jgi:hypothetical protein
MNRINAMQTEELLHSIQREHFVTAEHSNSFEAERSGRMRYLTMAGGGLHLHPVDPAGYWGRNFSTAIAICW